MKGLEAWSNKIKGPCLLSKTHLCLNLSSFNNSQLKSLGRLHLLVKVGNNLILFSMIT
jgi:hypothetical protein